MNAYIQHVGEPGNKDIAYTVTRRRTIDEVAAKLSPSDPEWKWFQSGTLQRAFPSGDFNCWGVPPRTEKTFARLAVGDVVFLMPTGGTYGEVEQFGIVRAVCPVKCSSASSILWYETPGHLDYPWVFFFDTEAGRLNFSEFKEQLEYNPSWDLRGWFKPIAASRFDKWGGANAYIGFLRRNYGFKDSR